MSKFLVVTIDVEPDCTPTWNYTDPITFSGVSLGIGEILQPLFNRYNIFPTYLINNVVLEDDQSVETFRNLDGRFELGTHLHAEFIEPDRVYSNYAGKKGEMNQCFLPPDMEYRKLESITKLFVKRFNRQPTSFRAGRFSAGDNTMRSLSALGYKVDSSVTPNVCWNDQTRERAVDYRRALEQPYFVKANQLLEAGNERTILEVPVSIIRSRKYFVLDRPLWLRPFMSGYAEFTRIIDAYSRRYAHREHVVFNMMFHNVEVLPRLSPYPQTDAEAKAYIDSLENLFAYCNRQGIESVGLSDLYDIY